MPKFYVVTKSNWQGSDWKPVAGDFPTRQDAEAKLPEFQENPTQENGAVDIKAETHAKVVSRTELKRMGYSDERLTDCLYNEMLDDAQQADDERNYREQYG